MVVRVLAVVSVRTIVLVLAEVADVLDVDKGAATVGLGVVVGAAFVTGTVGFGTRVGLEGEQI